MKYRKVLKIFLMMMQRKIFYTEEFFKYKDDTIINSLERLLKNEEKLICEKKDLLKKIKLLEHKIKFNEDKPKKRWNN
jgi:hypothetical protein